MYPEKLVEPMRKELTNEGFIELRSASEVEEFVQGMKGTALVAVNSVCGCAAGSFRPGIISAVKGLKKPQSLATVFAGQDKEATEKMRSKFYGYPPSSPCAALLKDGEVLYMLERGDIEGFSSEEVASKLREVFDKHC